MCRGRLLVISDFGRDLVSGEIGKPVDERSNERAELHNYEHEQSIRSSARARIARQPACAYLADSFITDVR